MTPNQNLNHNTSPVEQEEFNWRHLIWSLDRSKIVPILGPNLFYIYDEKSNKVPLYEHMHHELLKEVDEENQDDDFWEFMEKNKEDLPILISDFMENNLKSIDKTPLIKLAKITGFRDYICMTYDNYFESILRSERDEKEKVQTIDFSITPNSKSKTETSGDDITIFNLLGSVNNFRHFAKTEEEIMEYFYFLTVENPTTNEFFSKIEGKNFLFIGCNFRNWLLRFFIRIITRERFSEAIIKKFIADVSTVNDPKLCMFLTRFNSSIFQVPDATALEFVDELYDRWNTEHPEGTVKNFKYPGLVFISYSSEDREGFAEELYNELKLRRVNVYYDQNKLVAGDNFSAEIKNSIKECKSFISLISKNSLDPKRYVRKEIEEAVNVEMARCTLGLKKEEDPSFIKPYIIDDTSEKDPELQKLFPRSSIERFQSVDYIVKAIINDLEKDLEPIMDPEA